MLGQYTFELEAGPEYKTQNGHFEIERHADDTKTIEMHRFADLSKEGWWSGDLDVSRPLVILPLAMRAENLNVAPVTAWQNVEAKWSEADERKGVGEKSESASRAFGAWAELDQRLGGGSVGIWGVEADGFECGDVGGADVAERAAGGEESRCACCCADAICVGSCRCGWRAGSLDAIEIDSSARAAERRGG